MGEGFNERCCVGRFLGLVDISGEICLSFLVIAQRLDEEGIDNAGNSFDIVKQVDEDDIDVEDDVCLSFDIEGVDGEGIEDAKPACDGCVLFPASATRDVFVLFGSFGGRFLPARERRPRPDDVDAARDANAAKPRPPEIPVFKGGAELADFAASAAKLESEVWDTSEVGLLEDAPPNSPHCPSRIPLGLLAIESQSIAFFAFDTASLVLEVATVVRVFEVFPKRRGHRR